MNISLKMIILVEVITSLFVPFLAQADGVNSQTEQSAPLFRNSNTQMTTANQTTSQQNAQPQTYQYALPQPQPSGIYFPPFYGAPLYSWFQNPQALTVEQFNNSRTNLIPENIL